MQSGLVIPDGHLLPDVRCVAKSVKPTASCNTKPVKKAPISESHICHQRRRMMETRVSRPVRIRQVTNDMPIDPAAGRHHHVTSAQTPELSALRVSHLNEISVLGFSEMLDTNDRRSESNSRRVLFTV